MTLKITWLGAIQNGCSALVPLHCFYNKDRYKGKLFSRSCGRRMEIKEDCLCRKLTGVWGVDSTGKRQADPGISLHKSLSTSKSWLLLSNPDNEQESSAHVTI